MTKTKVITAVSAIIIVATLFLMGYSVYAAHSTISSLKSELNSKNELIKSQDSLIHSDTQLVAQRDVQLITNSDTLISLKKDNDLLKQDYKKLSTVKLDDLKKYLDEKKVTSEFQNGWTITYYSLNTESTGKRPGQSGYGFTTSGVYVQDGVTIACPRQISLGTKIDIQGVGVRTCQDRGGGVKGKTLDIYVANKTYSQLMNLGRTPTKIRILDRM